jgi:hypothetical protein
MKFAVIAILFTYIGCQDYNSNSFDKDRYGAIELTGSAGFKASYPILQNKCMNCHRHSQWSGYTDERDWVNNENLINPTGAAGDSQLIYRIINHGGANSNMPVGGQALPPAEYETLTNWVSGVTP